MTVKSNSDSEPTLAQQARSLMESGGASSLATMSVKHTDYPFCSMVPYAVDDSGNPLFLLSQMAVHAKNLRASSRATLLVTSPSGALEAGRISVVGEVTPVAEGDRKAVAQAYLAKHPEAKQWVSFGDFGFYRMKVKDIYFIGGFGAMGWVNASEYAAEPPENVLLPRRWRLQIIDSKSS